VKVQGSLACKKANLTTEQKSDIFLIGAAFISFVLSVSLWFYGYKDEGLFVGLWVPSILSFGCYFKQMLNK
jgi:hypothetical protein